MKHSKSKVILALVMMIAILSSTTAFAATPRWSHLITITAGMTVDDSNMASISVYADGDARTVTSMKAKCQLQQLDGSWKTLKTWTVSNKSSAVMYEKNYSIAKNYSYRLRVTAYAYQNGSLLESDTVDFDYGYYN